MLVDTILAVLLALHSNEPNAVERMSPIAAAIAAESEAAPLWSGADGARHTALTLVAIGEHESHFRADVLRCERNGDGGRSISAYQLNGPWARAGHEVADVCADDALQARLALGVLAYHARRGVKGSTGLLRAFAAGDAGRASRAADELAATLRRAERLAAGAP